jgi:prolyl oligopeptidase
MRRHHSLVLLLPLLAAAGCATEELSLMYPETKRQEIVEEIHGQPVADPYRWLEDAGDPEVLAWMEAQDALTRQTLHGLSGREEIAARLTELFYYDAVAPPVHRGSRFFYTRRHADREKAILYWKEGDDGAERVLIDPNTLSSDGSISLGVWVPSHDGTLLAYTLRENNMDAATLYVRDVESGEDRPVDVIPGAKYASPSWTPDGRGFLYTRLPVDSGIAPAELPGRAELRFHSLGTDPAEDPLVHPALGDPSKFLGGYLSYDGRFLFAVVAHGWNATDVYYQDLARPGGPRRRPEDAGSRNFHTLVEGRPALFTVTAWQGAFYLLTNDEAPMFRVFRVDPDRPRREAWEEIVPEGDATIQVMGLVGGHLVLERLRNASSELEVRTLEGKPVRQVSLPGLGSVYELTGDEDRDDAYYTYSSFTEAPQIYRLSVSSGETSLWAETDFPMDTSPFTVEQVWYTSRDGTRVSMFIAHRRDLERHGDHPTILTGYGGFNVSRTPVFAATIVAWIERGGIWAVPNLRGGGEYGEEWHKAGMQQHKQNSFDDFIAAADYLIEHGYTRPERLAIRGGSNGGLLVGATMVQRPGLCRAVICAVPLLDMVRYHLVGSGMTWTSEYGSAEDPGQFEILYSYSPYHHLVRCTSYPATLILSADSDDRVDPMHARKFAAALQWATAGPHPVLLRIERQAGHGGADLVRQQVEETADTFAFLEHELGMD